MAKNFRYDKLARQIGSPIGKKDFDNVVSESLSITDKALFGIVSPYTDLLLRSDVVIKTGYWQPNGTYTNNENTPYSAWKTAIIPVLPNKTYKWKSTSVIPNTTVVWFDSSMTRIGYIAITLSNQFTNEQTFVAPENCYYFGLQYSGGTRYFQNTEEFQASYDGLPLKVESLEKRVTSIEENGTGGGTIVETDYTPIAIPYLFYMVNPALYSREYPVRVFPESFLDFKPTVPITTNYRRDAALSRQKKTTTSFETVSKSIVLRGSGYKEKTVSVNLHCINEQILANKNIRLLMFGVSFDDINYKSSDGTSEVGGTKTANLIEKLSIMGAIDTGSTRQLITLGSLINPGDFPYSGQTKHIYGCSEARGGNGGVNYLRQPMHFSPADVSYDPNVAGTSATGLIMWLMNGLRYRIPYNATYSESGTDYGAYERTTDKTDALRCTPFCKYHHNYAQELWDFCNRKGWITAVGGTYSPWSNSAEQRAIIDQCMDYISNNPEYPWYSRDKARETSFSSGVAKDVTDNTQYAIDMSVYLSRYRTMDDLGVRLVNGATNPAGLTATGSDGITYTIGSKITTQTKLTTINVCKPTHVIWDMAYNDWPFYVSSTGQSSGSDSLALSQLFISAIQAQLGTGVKIGLKAKKDNGSFFPETWGDVALAQGYNASGHLVNYNKLLISAYSDLSAQVNWIPIFPVSIPFASNFLQQQEDFVYGKTLVNSGDTYSATSDVTHEGLASAKAMAYQIYGWLAYTVK